MTSKAERIRELLAEGKLTPTEIANRTGVLTAYVRAVRHRMDPTSWYGNAARTGDWDLSRQEARKAYKRARKKGKSRTQAQGVYVTAQRAVLARTRVEMVS